MESKLGDDLPLDIINLILLMLPIKSLLRFRCVCKSWYNLIRNSGFYISKHTLSHKDDMAISYLLHKKYQDTNKDRLYRWNKVIRLSQLLDLPPPLDNNYDLFFHGSCDGLVCLTVAAYKNWGRRSNAVFLWNPSINKVKKIVFGDPSFDYICGFGPCKTGGVDDYKVVKLSVENKSEADVYTLSTKSSKRIVCKPFELIGADWPQQHSVAINGVLHWIRVQCYIYTFDLQTDVTGYIRLPESNDRRNRGLTRCIGNFNGYLSLINVNENSSAISIWVMEEYGVHESWTKHFTTNLAIPNCNISNVQQMCLGSHCFMLDTGLNWFLVYDFEKRVPLKPLRVKDNNDMKRPLMKFRSIEYTESLVLLDEEC